MVGHRAFILPRMFSTCWAGILLFICVTSPKIFQNGKKDKNQSVRQLEREQIMKLLSCPECFPPVEQEYYFSSVWPPMIFQNGKKDEYQSRRQLEREQILKLLSCPECFLPGWSWLITAVRLAKTSQVQSRGKPLWMFWQVWLLLFSRLFISNNLFL